MAQILITNITKNAGGIFLLETRSGKLTQLYDQPTHGIARTPHGFFFVENYGSIWHMEPGTWAISKRAETGFDGCHDLRYIDGSFYLVASTGNWVARLNEDLEVVDRMQIVDSDDDVCHANCLIERNGELLLSIFTLSPGRRQEKRFTQPWRTEGKILRLDWQHKRFEVAYEPLCQPHSLTPRGDLVYLCESFTSELSAVSVDKQQRRLLRKFHGFLRGIAFADGKAYVGISQWLRAANRWERFLNRFRMPCGVMELDTKSWKPRRSFPVPGQQVYELLAIEGGD